MTAHEKRYPELNRGLTIRQIMEKVDMIDFWLVKAKEEKPECWNSTLAMARIEYINLRKKVFKQ